MNKWKANMSSQTTPVKHRVYNEFVMESSRWDNFKSRPDDIIIATPAKCGTTWTQMICALLIFQKTEFDKRLTECSPWVDVLTTSAEDVLNQLEQQTHRRFIKTHTPLDGLNYNAQSKYICVGRDPRDAFLSLKNHVENMRPEALETLQKHATGEWHPPQPPVEDQCEWFRRWISSSFSEQPGHNFHTDVLYYVNSFWQFKDLPNILMVHYSDLKADLAGEMKRIAEFLEIEVADALWPELVAAATFENMKGKADRLAPQVGDGIWKDPNQFFNKGASGQWRDILGTEELALYHQVMSEKLEPELATWLEKGRLASS
jgi:hypothetical protein